MTIKRFKGSNARVCVAVKFDDPSRRAVKIAEQYCHRIGAEIHLIHICENLLTSNMAAIASNSLVGVPAEVLQIAQDNIQEEAEKNLLEMSQLVKAPIKVSMSVLGGMVGTPAELIEAEALSSRSGMIVVAASPGSHRFVPKGFSCALSLMSKAKLPVMVITSNQSVDFSNDRLNIVIADDLKPGSLPAVVGGCELAFALGNTNINHIHVNGMTVEALKSALVTAIGASHSQPDPTISANEIYSLTTKHLENRLEERTAGMNIPLDMTGCKYNRALLADSSVVDCLERYANERKANLVVMGRHQTFHRKPFNIGQMPFYAMLTLRCPVVMFPSDEV